MSHEAAALPRTEGERHLPGGSAPSLKELNRTESPDEETLRMMEEAGFDSSMPIDPSSLKALQELLTPKHSHGKSTAKVEDLKPAAIPNLTSEEAKEETKEQSSVHVPSEVLRPIALGRVTSDLTMGLRSETMMEEETDASTAGSTQRAATTTDKRILDQLQMQTALLLDLQRRVDELSQLVTTQQQQLQQQGNLPPVRSDLGQPRSVPPQAANQREGANVPPVPQQDQQQPRNAPPPAQERPQMFVFSLFTSIPRYIRSTRVAEICRVYVALHRRDVGGRIDFNLIFKILIMGAILYAKFSASNKGKKDTFQSKIQFHVAVILIVGGFMLQSGYARFLHNFFVKERYVQRIWGGEYIDVAAQQRPRAAERREQRQEQGEEEAVQGPGLLRGGIAQAPEQGGNAIAKFVMDIFYLFGSFVLSILPMWKAEAQHQRGRGNAGRQQQNGQQNGGEEQQGGGGGNGE